MVLVHSGKNVSAISARNIFLIKNFAGVAESNQLTVEENHLIEKFWYRFQIVMRGDDKIPGSCQLARQAPWGRSFAPTCP